MIDRDDDMRHVHGEGQSQRSQNAGAARVAGFYGGRQGD